MNGAIVGDILGSIYEKIPKHPIRVVMQATDDSILTCACYDWVNSLDDDLKNLHTEKTQNKIYRKAVTSLKKWAKRFPEKSGFSKGFTDWAAQKNFNNKVANTNGCIMRSSPISAYSFKNNLSKSDRHLLLKIFCSTTHDHIEAYQACYKHSDLICYSLENNLENTRKYILENYAEDLKSAQEWNLIANEKPGKFIWTAKESLSIAISSIYYSSSWQEMMDFFNVIEGDVDTYAAIAGPIAQSLYPDFKKAYEEALNVILESSRNNDLHILKILNKV